MKFKDDICKSKDCKFMLIGDKLRINVGIVKGFFSNVIKYIV